MSYDAPPDNYQRTCIRWDGGWLEFDAVVSEDIILEADVTEFPVEPGAGPGLTDNSQPRQAEVTLEAVISNSPVTYPLTHADGMEPVDADLSVVLTRPLVPQGLGPLTTAGNQISDALSSTTGGLVSLEAKTAVKLDVRTYDPELRRVQNAYAEFVTMLREARRVTVVCGRFIDLTDCILKLVHPRRTSETGGSLHVTLKFTQVSIGYTDGKVERVPSVPRSQLKKAGGRAQNAAASSKDQQQAESLLQQLLGG